MTKILLVEDDPGLGESIVDFLESENYFVDWQSNGDSGLDYLKSFEYDAVILDWELPGMSGPEILKAYRQRGGNAPVLFLTQRDSMNDKEIGFNTGADDYLAKPFAFKELGLRLRALMRRPKTSVDSVIKAGDLEIHPATHEFFRSGKKIKLSPIEFALMEFFMKNQGTVFSGDAILDRVWPGSSDRSPDTLRTCMRRLRLKIYAEGEDSAIRTVHGVGYKFDLVDN